MECLILVVLRCFSLKKLFESSLENKYELNNNMTELSPQTYAPLAPQRGVMESQSLCQTTTQMMALVNYKLMDPDLQQYIV